MTVYHITNLETTEWKSLSGLVAKACDAKIVSLDEWVQSLELLVTSGDANLRGLPAAGLLDFFRMLVNRQCHPMPALDVANTQVVFPTLRGMGPVDEKMMEVWGTTEEGIDAGIGGLRFNNIITSHYKHHRYDTLPALFML